MKNLEKQVLNLINHHFNLAHNFATLAEEDFYNQWYMIITDLHHACAILTLYLLDDLIIRENVAVRSKLLDTVRKLTTCIDDHYKLWANFKH